MKLGRPGVDGWMFDLVARDDVVHGRALARHQKLVARGAGAYDRDRTIFGYLDGFLYADSRDSAVRWPFVALYLRWEARCPDEWGSRDSNSWSPWTRKEVLLRHLERRGVPEEMRPDAADLIVAAIQRPYRCKDWMYARLVRQVAGAEFRGRVTELAGADDPFVRLRARFLLDLVDHPEHRVTRTAWRRWLEHQQD